MKVEGAIPESLRLALEPLLAEISSLTESIQSYDRQIEELAQTKYPETTVLRQVTGVGALTALSFVLTLEDPRRFRVRVKCSGSRFSASLLFASLYLMRPVLFDSSTGWAS